MSVIKKEIQTVNLGDFVPVSLFFLLHCILFIIIINLKHAKNTCTVCMIAVRYINEM